MLAERYLKNLKKHHAIAPLWPKVCEGCSKTSMLRTSSKKALKTRCHQRISPVEQKSPVAKKFARNFARNFARTSTFPKKWKTKNMCLHARGPRMLLQVGSFSDRCFSLELPEKVKHTTTKQTRDSSALAKSVWWVLQNGPLSGPSSREGHFGATHPLFLRIHSVQSVINNPTQLSGSGFPYIFYIKSILS